MCDIVVPSCNASAARRSIKWQESNEMTTTATRIPRPHEPHTACVCVFEAHHLSHRPNQLEWPSWPVCRSEGPQRTRTAHWPGDDDDDDVRTTSRPQEVACERVSVVGSVRLPCATAKLDWKRDVTYLICTLSSSSSDSQTQPRGRGTIPLAQCDMCPRNSINSERGPRERRVMSLSLASLLV